MSQLVCIYLKIDTINLLKNLASDTQDNVWHSRDLLDLMQTFFISMDVVKG